MKVIKRNGNIVEFDKTKIENAIKKANNEVKQKDKANQQEINEIINYIINLNKKQIPVEEIQDIIETKLMQFQKYNLAKNY